MSNLTILLTNKCNLSCTFCSNKKMMRDGTKPNKSLDVILEELLYNEPNKYTRFHLSGGEPTLNSELLENILSVLLSNNSEAEIHLYTNGSYLSEGMVNVLNQYPNIIVNISIDRVDQAERGLLQLLDKSYQDGYSNVLSILHLKHKRIRVVAPRELFKSFTFAMELFMLYQTFQCPISIDIDWTKENTQAIDLDDVYNIGECIGRLASLGVYREGIISFNKFFIQPCTSDCGDMLKWDGTLLDGCYLQSSSGCEMLRQKMKPGIYDLISQFVNFQQFEYNNGLSDRPQYIPDVGHIGERSNVEPLRKQLQYEDRVNYRYRQLNAIDVKEVQ